jgi:IS5 family transposase
MALGVLIFKTLLGLTDEELVEQVKENPCLQFFLGLEALHYSWAFVPTMMVFSRHRLQKVAGNDSNEPIIVRNGLRLIRL